jgi:imidazolonepropionase-like amidohydrolase
MTKFLRSAIFAVAASLFCLSMLAAAPAPPPANRLALVGGTVISGTGADPIPNATVLIENGRVTAVGPSASVAVPPGTEIVNVRGKFITPGLIDTNVHLVLMTVPEFFIKYENKFEDIAVESAQVGLKYGFTTLMDTWGPLESLLKARDRLSRGDVLGSRVLIGGNIIGMGGPFSPYMLEAAPLGAIDFRYGGWVHPAIQQRINDLWEAGMGPRLLALTPSELAIAMREYLAKGVDFVKVAVSAHGIGPVEPLMFSPDQPRAMRQEVRSAGRPFLTHTFTLESLRLAVDVDADLLQHPNVMQPEPSTPSQIAARDALIAEIKRKNIYCALMLIPSKEQSTIIREWKPEDHPNDLYINQIMASRRAGSSPEIYRQHVADLRPWLDAKVPFTLATDGGLEVTELGPVVWGRLGRFEFERMEALQDAGASRMEILMGATRRGAEAYGLGRDLGTVEHGKIADLLVLDANPLDDVHNFRKIDMVLKDGRVVDRKALPTVHAVDYYDPEAKWPF